MMRTLIVGLSILSIAGLASAKPENNWEVRKKPGGECEVKRTGEKPEVGSHVAGPFKTKKGAEEELDRVKKSPKCRK